MTGKKTAEMDRWLEEKSAGAAGAARPCVPTTARMRQHLKRSPTSMTFPQFRLPKSCWHENDGLLARQPE